MQIDLKRPESAIEVQNREDLLTLKIDKKAVVQLLRNLAVMALFAVLSVLLIYTFQSGSEFFWPLLKASFILVMVAFVAYQSNSQIKKQH